MADMLVDIVTEDGLVWQMNAEQQDLLGLSEASGPHAIGGLYTPQSCIDIQNLFSRSAVEGFQATMALTLIGRGNREIRTIARCTCIEQDDRIAFRLTKILLGAWAERIDDIEYENQVLREIIEEATEGHWCIEFIEPIDVSRPLAEIIDQIFENASIWRVANQAMARIYDLPIGESVQPNDVRLRWPRNEENERFVEQIIVAGYHIDRAISYDVRHDGTVIHCENDVRADIQAGFLRRIWGNCRYLPAGSDPAASKAEDRHQRDRVE
jgi:hypothetical protein